MGARPEWGAVPLPRGGEVLGKEGARREVEGPSRVWRDAHGTDRSKQRRVTSHLPPARLRRPQTGHTGASASSPTTCLDAPSPVPAEARDASGGGLSPARGLAARGCGGRAGRFCRCRGRLAWGQTLSPDTSGTHNSRRPAVARSSSPSRCDYISSPPPRPRGALRGGGRHPRRRGLGRGAGTPLVSWKRPSGLARWHIAFRALLATGPPPPFICVCGGGPLDRRQCLASCQPSPSSRATPPVSPVLHRHPRAWARAPSLPNGCRLSQLDRSVLGAKQLDRSVLEVL